MRHLLLAFIVLAFTLVTSSNVLAKADDWPSKPLKIIVGYGAGGSADLSTRLLAKLLEAELGQPVVVQNKPGAAGAMAATMGVAMKKDGYNFFTMLSAPAAITPHMQKVPFDPTKDFTHIAQFVKWHYSLAVKADAPWSTFEEFIEYAQSKPGEISYGLSGNGNPQHLAMLQIGLEKGLDWKAIPFKNDAEASLACLGGHVTVNPGVTGWVPHVQAGKMRLLATFDSERMAEYPDVPTLKELGYGVEVPSTLGISGPKGIDPEISKKLSAAIKKCVNNPEFIALTKKLFLVNAYLDQDNYPVYIKDRFITEMST